MKRLLGKTNLIILIVVFFIFAITGYGLVKNTQASTKKTEEIAENVEKIAEGLKESSKANQSIAKQNRSYTKCIAILFAKYTQDNKPIFIKDLDKCTVESQSRSTNNSTTSGVPKKPETKSSGTKDNPPAPPTPPGNDDIILDLPFFPDIGLRNPF